MRSGLQELRQGDCSRNIPQHFTDAVDGLLSDEIDDDEFVRRTDGYVRRLASYHRTRWGRWHLPGTDVDDLAAIAMIEILCRLGRCETEKRTWDPNHPSGTTAAAYAYMCATRAISNRIKQLLKVRTSRTQPVQYTPDVHVITRFDRPVEPDEPVLPERWADAIERRFAGRATPREIVAIEATVRAIEAGGRIPEIVHDAETNPHRYGGLSGSEVCRLIDAVVGRKWERRTVSPESRPLVRPVGREAYAQYMSYDERTEPTPEQRARLALVPSRERDAEEISAAITADTIDALEHEVSIRYFAVVSGSLSLARTLHTIKTHELWSLDDRYTSFGAFVVGALRADGTVSRSTAYELVRAYDAALSIAEEYGREITELWDEIGTSKLQLLADPDEEIRARLTEIAIGGGSRNEMKAARAEITAAESAEEIEDADVVDEDPPRHEPAALSEDADIQFDADDDPSTVTLHGTVPDGVPIRLIPRDKEGEHDSLRGMRITDAAGRLYFTHRPHPSNEIAFGLEVSPDGRIIGGDIMYSSVRRK